jgi:hypothetical protein
MSRIRGGSNEGTVLAVNESSEMLEVIDPARGETRLMACVYIIEEKTQMNDSMR